MAGASTARDNRYLHVPADMQRSGDVYSASRYKHADWHHLVDRRIGHLGDCNDMTLLAALSGCEMGLKLAGVKLAGSGVQAAMD